VSAAFAFSAKTNVTLAIKNTGVSVDLQDLGKIHMILFPV
jgi:hypothetical protein